MQRSAASPCYSSIATWLVFVQKHRVGISQYNGMRVYVCTHVCMYTHMAYGSSKNTASVYLNTTVCVCMYVQCVCHTAVYVCACVCMYMYTHVCVYVYMCGLYLSKNTASVYLSTTVCVCLYVHMYAYITKLYQYMLCACICMYVYIYGVCSSKNTASVYLNTQRYVCVCLCARTMYANITQRYMYVYMYMYVCLYTYMYVCTHIWRMFVQKHRLSISKYHGMCVCVCTYTCMHI
jgi:hypothetical protein